VCGSAAHGRTEDGNVADKYCDLVMKGGITSGIVYPNAVLSLAREYRFKSIGGTSAGAIAAAVAFRGWPGYRRSCPGRASSTACSSRRMARVPRTACW
jgi:hypothetical protein